MLRTATGLAAALLVSAALVAGCASSSDTGAFCAASASLTSGGTAIQRLSPNDLAQVKTQVAALVPEAQTAESKAPKAIRDDVKVLGDALEQFASSVARAGTTQELITAFSAYNERAKDLSDPASHVEAWVGAHCGGTPSTPG